MTKRFAKRFAAMCVLVTSCVLVYSDRRPTAHLDYNAFANDADVIVVGHPISNTDTNETLVQDGKVLQVGVDTVFQVKTSLKGKVDQDRLTVFHHKITEAGVALIMTATYVSFPLDGSKELDYLLFLKKRSDGRYDIVNKNDPAYATFIVAPMERAYHLPETKPLMPAPNKATEKQ